MAQTPVPVPASSTRFADSTCGHSCSLLSSVNWNKLCCNSTRGLAYFLVRTAFIAHPIVLSPSSSQLSVSVSPVAKERLAPSRWSAKYEWGQRTNIVAGKNVSCNTLAPSPLTRAICAIELEMLTARALCVVCPPILLVVGQDGRAQRRRLTLDRLRRRQYSSARGRFRPE